MELRRLAGLAPGLGAMGSLLVIAASALWIRNGTLEGVATWMGAVGGVSLIAYALLDQERLSDVASTRAFVHSVRSGAAVVLAAGLAMAVYAAATRNDVTWDLTREGTYTLSDQGRRVAQALDVDVAITAYFTDSSPAGPAFADLVERFEQASDRIEVEFVDPLAQSARARADGITGEHGTVLVRANDRTERLEWEVDEADLVRALVLLQSAEDHLICWSVGHGEPDPDDEVTDRGLGALRVELERLDHTVVRQRLAQQPIDRACQLLLVARPEIDLRPYELEAIAAYVAEGGRAWFMLDPFVAPALAEDLERYGVLLDDTAVRDADPDHQLVGIEDLAILVLAETHFGLHPVTRDLTAAVVLPDARPVTAMLESPGRVPTVVLASSERAWGERRPDIVPVRPDADEPRGELPVMVAIEIEDPDLLAVKTGAAPEMAPTTPDEVPAHASVPDDFLPRAGGRVVIIGDSDFAGNTFLGWGNNRDLALNTVAWLLDEEEQIGERPIRQDTLEISSLASNVLCVVGVFLLPGFALAVAAVHLMRRRRL